MNKIDHLKKRIDYNQEQRKRDKQRSERDSETRRTIDESPGIAKMDFWCEKCRQDFTGEGIKAIPYGLDLNSNEHYELSPLRAYYIGHCPTGHRAIRYITDKHRDPYFYQSVMLQHQRVEYADDILQPSDERFRKVYGDPLKPYYEAQEQEERANWKKRLL